MLDDLKGILKEAEQLKSILEKRFIQVEKDIEKISDEKMKEYLKNSLSLAKNNKLNISEFIQYINQCQQK